MGRAWWGGPWSLSREPEMVSKQGGAGTHGHLRRAGGAGVGWASRGERAVDARLREGGERGPGMVLTLGRAVRGGLQGLCPLSPKPQEGRFPPPPPRRWGRWTEGAAGARTGGVLGLPLPSPEIHQPSALGVQRGRAEGPGHRDPALVRATEERLAPQGWKWAPQRRGDPRGVSGGRREARLPGPQGGAGLPP